VRARRRAGKRRKSVRLLDATLAEEKETDQALTELAESVVNQAAEAA
jgi:ferritin-like metal-binding protein YciE